MPTAVTALAVRASHRGGRVIIPLRILPIILPEPSILTARRAIVFTMPIINVLPGMWISKAAGHATARGLRAQPLRRSNILI